MTRQKAAEDSQPTLSLYQQRLLKATGFTPEEVRKLAKAYASISIRKTTPIPDGFIWWANGRRGCVRATFEALSLIAKIKKTRSPIASRAAIAAVAGMHEDSIKRAMPELEDGGWVRREFRKIGKKKNGWTIYHLPRITKRRKPPLAGRTAAPRIMLQRGAPTSADTSFEPEYANQWNPNYGA